MFEDRTTKTRSIWRVNKKVGIPKSVVLPLEMRDLPRRKFWATTLVPNPELVVIGVLSTV